MMRWSATVAIAKRGIANFLKHAGILSGEPERAASIRLEMPDERCFVVSETAVTAWPAAEPSTAWS